MSKIQNIDSHIIADIAERIERLITNARANVARVVNITEVITKYEIGRIIVNKKVKNVQHTVNSY